MTLNRVPLVLACWLLTGVAPLACQRRPANRTPLAGPLATQFKDTALVSVTRFAAREFDLQRPAHRDSLRAILRRERELWRAQAPKDYRFLLNVSCFCPGVRGWLLMEVRAGQPLKAWDRAGKPVPLSDWNTRSVDDLFNHLESLEGNVSVQIGFDPRWHYPAYVATSYRPGPDRWGVTEARGLRPI